MSGDLIPVDDGGNEGITISPRGTPEGYAFVSVKEVVAGTELTLTGSVEATASISAVTAAKLARGKQVRTTITCTNANTDYYTGAVIPADSKYAAIYCLSDCRVAVDEATAAAVGMDLPGGQAVVVPLTITAVLDGKLHAQSATAGAVVNVTWLQD